MFIRVTSSEKVAVWTEKTFSVSELRRAVLMACKLEGGVSFEIGSDEEQVRERNLKAEDAGGPCAAYTGVYWFEWADTFSTADPSSSSLNTVNYIKSANCKLICPFCEWS